MKKTTLFFLALIAFAACKEPYNPNFTQGVITDTSFKMTTVSSMSTTGIGSQSQDISFTHNGTTPKNITLSATGLPTGATAVFSPASGTTPFKTSLSIKTKLVKTGTYNFKIQSFSSGSTVGQEQTTTLMVQPTPKKECDNFFFTAMSGKPVTTQSSIYNLVYGQTTVKQNSNGELYFDDVMLDYSSYTVLQRTSSDPIIFSVDCETGQIKIEEQNVGYTSTAYGRGTVTVSGNGVIDFTKNTYKVTYTNTYGTFTLEGFVVL